MKSIKENIINSIKGFILGSIFFMYPGFSTNVVDGVLLTQHFAVKK